MSRRTERLAARKARDKWKAKSWYTIVAPETFAFKELGETPAAVPEHLLGRVTETTLYDLTGNLKKSYIKLYFKITKIDGSKALTTFIGHDTLADYTRRIVRRRKTRIDAIFSVRTSDGYVIRIKITVVADKRINSSLETALRKKIIETVTTYASKNTFSELIKYMISDTIVSDITTNLKPIYPIRKLEIRKSDLIKAPEDQLITSESSVNS